MTLHIHAHAAYSISVSSYLNQRSTSTAGVSVQDQRANELTLQGRDKSSIADIYKLAVVVAKTHQIHKSKVKV